MLWDNCAHAEGVPGHSGALTALPLPGYRQVGAFFCRLSHLTLLRDLTVSPCTSLFCQSAALPFMFLPPFSTTNVGAFELANGCEPDGYQLRAGLV